MNCCDQRWARYMMLPIKYIMSIVLLVSGFSKCFYIRGFASEVSQFTALYILPGLETWSLHAAIVVCIVEIVLGFSLLVKRWNAISVPAVFILFSFFLYLTGRNYLFPSYFGSIESCGCFGELIHFSAKGSFYKSIVLWFLSFSLECKTFLNRI